MADEKVEIEIVLDDGSIQKGFVKVEKQAKKTGDKVENSLGSSFRKLGPLLAGVAASIGAAIGTRAAISAAVQQEQAVKNLNIALSNAGTFSKEASESIQSFATELQRTTRFGDEVILQQFALARNFASSNEEAQALTAAAIDLSEATGISLDSAVKNLGKTFAGLTGELGESVPALRNLTAEELKAGKAIELVSKLFGGTAQESVKTFGGALEQLQNSFGDFLEALGELVTKSPQIISFVNSASEAFANLASGLRNLDSLGDISDSLKEVAKGFRLAASAALSFLIVFKAGTVIKAIAFEINALIFLVKNIPRAFAIARASTIAFATTMKSNLASAIRVNRIAFKALLFEVSITKGIFAKAAVGIRGFVTVLRNTRLAVNLLKGALTLGLTLALDLLIEKIFIAKEEFGGFTRGLKALFLQTKLGVTNLITDILVTLQGTSLNKFFDFGDSIDTLKIKSAELRKELRLLKEESTQIPEPDVGGDDQTPKETADETANSIQTVGEGFDNFVTGFKAQAKSLAKTSQQAFQQVGRSALDGLGKTAGNAFAQFGRALAQGENGFKAFAGAILQGFAQVAVQLGTQFILTGIAYSFSGIPELEKKASPLIAAGAALATFGGILSALGGGGGEGAAAGSAPGGIEAEFVADEDIGEEELQEEKVTQVAINVSGQVLDPLTVGNQIAQVLNDAFEAGGTRVVTT